MRTVAKPWFALATRSWRLRDGNSPLPCPLAGARATGRGRGRARQPEGGRPVLALSCRAGRPVLLALLYSELPQSSFSLSFSGMPNVPARLGGWPVLALESWPRPWAYPFPYSQRRNPRAPRRASGTPPMPADRAASRRHSLSARSDGSRQAFYLELLPRRTRSGAIRLTPTGVRPAKTQQRMIKIVIQMDAAPSLPRGVAKDGAPNCASAECANRLCRKRSRGALSLSQASVKRPCRTSEKTAPPIIFNSRYALLEPTAAACHGVACRVAGPRSRVPGPAGTTALMPCRVRQAR